MCEQHTGAESFYIYLLAHGLCGLHDPDKAVELAGTALKKSDILPACIDEITHELALLGEVASKTGIMASYYAVPYLIQQSKEKQKVGYNLFSNAELFLQEHYRDDKELRQYALTSGLWKTMKKHANINTEAAQALGIAYINRSCYSADNIAFITETEHAGLNFLERAYKEYGTIPSEFMSKAYITISSALLKHNLYDRAKQLLVRQKN